MSCENISTHSSRKDYKEDIRHENPSSEIDTVTQRLWNELITTGLQTSLWKKDSAYHSGHFYMIPLHASFRLNQPEWQKQFAAHFRKFAEHGIHEVETTRLYRLQYYYLASWFMLLAAESGQNELIPPNLFNIVYTDINNLWNKDKAPVWKWEGAAVTHFDNLRSRIVWKLHNDDVPEKTYQRAIIDAENFTFAIAANLKSYLVATSNRNAAYNTMLDDMLNIAKEVFENRAVWNNDGGWLFQPGYWANHKDFVYAGNHHKNNPIPMPVENISEDVSHSHRMALWLTSLSKATGEKLYDSLRTGLEYQFLTHVLIPPSDSINTYLTYNFMDGYNGLYRWNYNKDKPNTGYGAYELSGTILLGWWAFLESSRIADVYCELYERTPIPSHLIALYQGRTGLPPDDPNSHPWFWYLSSNFPELNCRLAAVLK